MGAKLPLRISSMVLLLFALGHTAGFLSFQPTEPEAVGVLESMRRVPFDFGGPTRHWIDLFTGFGLAISVAGFVSTVIAWRLSSATASEASLARTIAWLLCAIQIANVILSLRYFGPVQAAFSVACAALLAWGALRFNTPPD
ncbi:MAG: hypothetical protein C5B51_06155 [Terriglobia bacterium]|nr:MAG: hypothetical protein C5B51_06155 [Terriglobia bacterium]